MRNRVKLPQVLGFRLYDFRPIFKDDIDMSLTTGPYIILGGNGLGKTTTVQAIVYGLAGDLSDDSIEPTKSSRWDHHYFRDRLDPEYIPTATVEVDFTLGDTTLSARRGFKSSKVIGFRMGNDEWIENPTHAPEAFEDAVMKYGAYRHLDDFRFLVHRLLYLPESRRLIAWDYDAQIRILMLLNQDLIDENIFREQQAELKNIDSEKRHIHVALVKITSEIKRQNAEQAEEGKSNIIKSNTTKLDLDRLINQLQNAARNRRRLQTRVDTIADELSDISTQVEALRTEIEHTEATLIATSLRRTEDAYQLAMHKLLENGICPACGTYQSDMQDLAREHARNHRCFLCGSMEPHKTDPELTTLRSQLSEKLRAQQELESKYHNTFARFQDARKQESQIQSKVNRIRFDQPIVALIERHLTDFLRQKDLPELKHELEIQESELEAQLNEKQGQLEQEYQDFLIATKERTEDLRQRYERYATDFLGLPCTLSDRPRHSGISLSQFVPEFEDKRRDTPESCSEAQRFFIDIAFRLALVDWASNESKNGATFICETPETALDMSYVDNVVKMFTGFTQMGHSMLLTANIQPYGIAEKLMSQVPEEERSSHVLDLLEIGRPSKVHVNSMPELVKVINRIKGEE